MKKIILCFVFILFTLNFVSALGFQNISNPSQTILSNQIALPNIIQSSFQTFFKLPIEMPLTLQSAVLLIVLFIVILFVINSIISITPFFQGKASGIIASIILASIISLSGGIYNSLVLLNGFGDSLAKLSNWTGLGIIFSLAFLIFLSVAVWFVMNALGKLISKEEAHSSGFQIGKNVTESSMYGRIFKKSI